jgi:hypothetical protein
MSALRAMPAGLGTSGKSMERQGLAVLPGTRVARDRKIMELREAGWRVIEIARELSLSTDWVARALARVAGELGDLPRYRDYEQLAAGREDLPSAAILRQRLGRWSQIAAELGERRAADAPSGRRATNHAPQELPEGTYAAA